jgi:hypothetical protein
MLWVTDRLAIRLYVIIRFIPKETHGTYIFRHSGLQDLGTDQDAAQRPPTGTRRS